MPTRSAGNDAHLREFAELFFGELHFIEKDSTRVLRDAAEKRVPHGAGLLENLLLHEMLVAVLFRHDGVPGDMLRGALHRTSIVIHDADALLGQNRDVAIGEEKDLARVFQQRGDVAGNEIFAVTQSDDGGWAKAGGDNFLRVFRGEKNQGINAA